METTHISAPAILPSPVSAILAYLAVARATKEDLDDDVRDRVVQNPGYALHERLAHASL